MIDRIAKLIHRNILFVQETTQSMSQKMEAASEATAVAIEQNEVVEANGVADETSSEAESEREAEELDITTHGDEEREMDAKKEDLLKVSSVSLLFSLCIVCVISRFFLKKKSSGKVTGFTKNMFHSVVILKNVFWYAY